MASMRHAAGRTTVLVHSLSLHSSEHWIRLWLPLGMERMLEQTYYHSRIQLFHISFRFRIHLFPQKIEKMQLPKLPKLYMCRVVPA